MLYLGTVTQKLHIWLLYYGGYQFQGASLAHRRCFSKWSSHTSTEENFKNICCNISLAFKMARLIYQNFACLETFTIWLKPNGGLPRSNLIILPYLKTQVQAEFLARTFLTVESFAGGSETFMLLYKCWENLACHPFQMHWFDGITKSEARDFKTDKCFSSKDF